MIVNVRRRTGDSTVLERVDGNLLFEGGAAREGVLATFQLDGHEVTGRVVRVLGADTNGAADDASTVEIELIDEDMQDIDGEIARVNLPPENDTDVKV